MTDCAIKAKHWVLRHYLWVALTLLFLALAVGWSIEPKTWKEWAPIISVPVAFLLATQKQKLDELKLFKELFTEFNQRYDAIDAKLHAILKEPPDMPPSSDEQALLFRYFNLCGEEYLFYEQGYIYPNVWKAWYSGMKIFRRQNPRIKDSWDEELRTGSYYGLTFDDIEEQPTQTPIRENDQKRDNDIDSSQRRAA